MTRHLFSILLTFALLTAFNAESHAQSQHLADSLLQRIETLTLRVDSLLRQDRTTAPETAETPDTSTQRDTLSGPFSWLADLLPESFHPFLAKLNQPDNLVGILIAPLLVFLLNWLLRRGSRWVANRTERFRLTILGLVPFINTFLWLLVLGYLLYGFLGNDLGLWLLVTTLVVGYAAKDGLQDLLGGIWILIEQPYKIGDRIAVENYYGEVSGIGVRSTRIVTLDDSLVTVPNSAILSGAVSNANSGRRDCMVVIDFYLPIDTDVPLARRLAREALISSPYLNYDKDFQILVFDYFQDRPATNLKLKAYVMYAKYEKAFAADVTQTAKVAFRAAGLVKGDW